MAFYKEIGAKHKEYLQKMNLEFQNKRQLMFQIDSYNIELGDKFQLQLLSDNASHDLAKNFKHDDNLKKHVLNELQDGIQKICKKRVDVINDPQEIIDSLDFENFSLETVE